MPSSLLLLLLLPVLLQAGPAPMTPDTSLEVRGQRTQRDAKQDSIKVLISEGCATQGDSSDPSHGGKELDLAPGVPLVLTHKIKLLPSGSGSGACGCEADFAALRERLERLEREVSALREKCGGAEGSCCTSKESKGAGCSIKPECPNECSDQGSCVDGRCVCFAGFSGPDCSESDCPGNCNDNGKCVNGQCVCDPGFTGPDCSDASCPGNCKRRGRCVNGQCVCNLGFTGPDCSQKACPDNCNDRGRCVNGKCLCDGGFTGDDCSESSCPGNCNSRGRCVNGLCVCDDGFTGPDCSENTCPNNCSNRGRCVNGKCVCEVGFSGPDCGIKGCPNNCNSRGRCVNGRCVCRRGFTGPDCSQCQAGMTGPNCDQVMSAVSQLSAQDITETSVTLVWTPPAVQYETYYITFSSQKESDQQISVQVEGSLTAFTQTGLAAGQEYRASIVGEADGKRGAESTAEFMTLISGPSDLKVVKTTTTTAVVQWERSQGEIDRYRLTITPNDGAGRSREMIVPADQNSAHIQQLEAGRLYDITLVAEKGLSRSKAATAQAVPDYLIQTLTPFTSLGTLSHSVSTAATPSPPPEQDPSPEVLHGSNPDEVPVRTKPVVIKMSSVNGTRPKLTGRPAWPRKPKIPGAFRFNATRAVPGGRRLVPNPLKKAPVVVKKNEQMVPREPKPDVQTVRDPGAERRDDKHPAPESGTDSETNRQSGSEEPTAASGSKEQPDVGMAGTGNDTDPESPGPTGTAQSQEKKCMNKIKVTHFRLPLKDRGCRGDAVSSDPDSLLTRDGPPSGEPDLDYTPDPLHRLLTETFNSLNITTFSVHLAKPEDISENAENVRRQILSGLKPLSSFSSSSSSSQSSSSSESSAPTSSSSSLSLKLLSSLPSSSSEPSSSSLTHSVSSSPSSSSFSSSSSSLSTADMSESSSPSSSSLTRLIPSSSSLPSASDSVESNELENSKGLADPAPPEDRLSSGDGGDSVYRPPKRGFIRRPRPNSGSFLNRTHVNLRVPHRSPLRLIPETETRHSSSSSSSSDEVNAPEEDRHEDRGGTSQNQKSALTERAQLPVRGPPNGGYRRRPFLNVGRLQNQTRPNLRPLAAPSRPLRPKEQVSTEMPAAAKDSDPSESVREEDKGRDDTRTRPSVQRPNLKAGYVRRPQPNGGSGTNLRPQTGPIRKPFPNRKPNAGSGMSVESQTKPREGGGTSGHQTTEQNVHTSTEGDQEGDQETPLTDGHSGSVRAQTDESRGRDGMPIQIEDTPSTVQGRPSSEETSSGSGPVTPPKTPPPTRTITAEHHTQVRHYTSGTHREEDPKTNQAFDEKRSPPPDVSSSGVLREPLDSVGVKNRTSDGFTLVWDSPEGKYKNFVVTRRKEGEKEEAGKQKENQEEDSGSETRQDGRAPEDHNRLPDTPMIRGDTESDKPFKKVLPGSARSFQFEDLPPQTEYTLTLLGKGSGLLSRLHKLVISTGPEPPSNIVFSKVTENSLTVSWTKPKSSISGFKVTYTHAEDGEPVSVSVDSENSTLDLSKLSPGSSYEVTVISTLDLDESDPIKDSVMTLPDPPTHLRAVNVTDTTALLLWRPALAAIDKYAIVYGSGTGSELRVTVSGNTAEQQLSGLEGSTTYTVTVTSQLGSMESSPASTTFTTTSSSSSSSGSGSDGPRDLQASNVTPRTAMLSWKPPSQPVGSYRLTYQTEGQEMKEVIVDAAVTQYNLSRLHAGSVYGVQLQAERGGRYLSAISTEFTTGTLRFPFPTDCSQELLNGIWTSGEVEIFPEGKLGTPMMVYCDMETDGGGWTVFQRRKDGSVDFFRSWKEYVSGFGDLSGEFWLGLDRLHNLTKRTRMTLRVDLRNGGESVFAQYSTFEVDKRNYRLTVGGYSGTAGDSLSYHNNRVFSTKDRDPAPFITRCALSYRGGWWYKNCHEANLNGQYGIDVKHQGVIWTSWKGKEFSIAFTEMKMRPAAFSPPARG